MRSALMHRRGWIRYLQDRYEEAEADLRQAIALSESSPHSYCLLSKILIDRGNYPEAMTAWQNAERYAQPRFPEQDECLYQAWEKLKGSANSSEYWVSGHR
ncbi:MAG: tetratricopeptide repeat protein [Coleofasciculaceae cyanobacterium SM2_3_26]|nr:tetratricopeptide repeat protein [Coleofasciculaceae cyanobacterium SM2_3_26]